MGSVEDRDFIRKEINKFRVLYPDRLIHTRFPPEPNGFLHIGHAKAIVLSFDIARENNGLCNLRFDDTNPEKEDQRFIQAIKTDLRWLGFDWKDRLFYASDYFDRLYQYAIQLIKQGAAYVDSLLSEEIRKLRGTPTRPGVNSPYRNRSKEENLKLFQKMRSGYFPDGMHCLRAKIDMSSPNINMRDPLIYRIRHQIHPRTGKKWFIYPLYDFAHSLSDAIEGITHSLCTLEFENHRPLYNWFLNTLNIGHAPQQIEFARLNLTNVVLSKRKLSLLVEKKVLEGWDDPRMPTLAGLRRRGCPPQAIRRFCRDIGVTKTESIINMSHFEQRMREYLNKHALRFMVVLDPLRVCIVNYPAQKTELFEAINNPEVPLSSIRKISFSNELYIERSDFNQNPPVKFFRLAPGKTVRLKHAYCVTCESYDCDVDGKVTTVYCRCDFNTRGGDCKGQKVRGTLHWVNVHDTQPIVARLYDRLFLSSDPSKDEDLFEQLNPHSRIDFNSAIAESALRGIGVGETIQFLRHGYFCKDSEQLDDMPVFNRTVQLKDSWEKIVQKAVLRS